ITPACDFAGAAEKLAQARRECGVAGIDGILGIADEMGEADLMVLLGPIHLGGEPVGNPKIGSVLAQELFDHGPVAVGMNDESAVIPPQPSDALIIFLSRFRSERRRLQSGVQSGGVLPPFPTSAEYTLLPSFLRPRQAAKLAPLFVR